MVSESGFDQNRVAQKKYVIDSIIGFDSRCTGRTIISRDVLEILHQKFK